MVVRPVRDAAAGEQHSVALGWGDNNDGEMQAILLGLRRAVARASEFPSQDGSRLPLLLFSHVRIVHPAAPLWVLYIYILQYI